MEPKVAKNAYGSFCKPLGTELLRIHPGISYLTREGRKRELII